MGPQRESTRVYKNGQANKQAPRWPQLLKRKYLSVQTSVDDDSVVTICWPLTWSSSPPTLTWNCPRPQLTALFSPTSCYFTPLLFSATPSLPTTPINSPVLLHPALPLPSSSSPSTSSSLMVFGARVGWGFWMGVSNFRNSWFVTHRTLCDSSKAMLHPCYAPVTHIVVRKHVLTHTFLVERENRLCQAPFITI